MLWCLLTYNICKLSYYWSVNTSTRRHSQVLSFYSSPCNRRLYSATVTLCRTSEDSIPHLDNGGSTVLTLSWGLLNHADGVCYSCLRGHCSGRTEQDPRGEEVESKKRWDSYEIVMLHNLEITNVYSVNVVYVHLSRRFLLCVFSVSAGDFFLQFFPRVVFCTLTVRPIFLFGVRSLYWFTQSN